MLGVDDAVGVEDVKSCTSTGISIVVALKLTCSVLLAIRLAVSVNPSVRSVSLTSVDKLSCGQCWMLFWENCNSVVIPLLSM